MKRDNEMERAAPLVLVVDDDVTVRAMAEHHFQVAGFEVMTLAQGDGVAEMFQTHRPDAVLLDVMLPDRDGYSVCRELRALPEAEHLPIAMLTSRDDEDAIRLSYEAGATEFVAKPLNWLHETYRLRYLLRGAETTRALARAREAVARGEREWKQTFDAIEDPVMLLSPDLEIIRGNAAAARLGHLPVGKLAGRKCSDVFACGGPDGKGCLASEVLASGESRHAEMREFGPEKRDCLVAASPVSTVGGPPTAVVYSVKDVTEYRELEREFLQAQKMEAVGILASGIAHDVNNLLQGILGWADALSAQAKGHDGIQEGLDEISEIAARGHALTRQLLLTSRKGDTPFGPVAVEPLVRETVELLGRTIPRTVETEVAIAADLWGVNGEAGHLRQVLMNLGINAVHAMPDGGVLSIRATNTTLSERDCRAHPGCEVGPYVLIAVADSGCGMDKATMEKMYEPFFTTKGPAEGTGLGLSVVYGIVRDHGGHLRCSSDPGTGTTFEVYLPALPCSSPQAAAAQDAGSFPTSGEGRTVLLVEDEPVIQRVVGSLFSRHGYRVISAADGLEALERYESDGGEIDAIVLDLNMPRMDGESCLKELVKRGCRVPVIVATGTLLSPEQREELQKHATGILLKPFRMKCLLEAVSKAVAEREVTGGECLNLVDTDPEAHGPCGQDGDD